MTVMGVSTTSEGYVGVMLISIIACGVLLFHALRRHTKWMRVVCGLGAIVCGLLSSAMAGLLVLSWFAAW